MSCHFYVSSAAEKAERSGCGVFLLLFNEYSVRLLLCIAEQSSILYSFVLSYFLYNVGLALFSFTISNDVPLCALHKINVLSCLYVSLLNISSRYDGKYRSLMTLSWLMTQINFVFDGISLRRNRSRMLLLVICF